MKKLVTTLCAFALCTLAASAAFAGATNIRISQMYGGGGGSGGTYLYDYVELFNPTGVAVNIGGWSLQYGSATGTSFGSAATNMYVFPAGTTIQPCKYLLIQCGAAGTNAVPAMPLTPDYITSNISASATNGKIALIKNGTGANACAGNTSGAIYADVLGYGSANCYETVAAGVLTNTSVNVRKVGGMQDTDSNTADFVATNQPVAAHNAASPANITCLATPATHSTWGQVKSIYR